MLIEVIDENVSIKKFHDVEHRFDHQHASPRPSCTDNDNIFYFGWRTNYFVERNINTIIVHGISDAAPLEAVKF